MSHKKYSPWLDLLYPSCCASCRKACIPVPDYPNICRKCLAKLPLYPWPQGIFPWPDFADTIDINRERILACARYDDSLRVMLRRFKEQDYPELVTIFAPLMERRLKQANISKPVLVAIPIPAGQRKKQGYNPSQLLVDELKDRVDGVDASACLLASRDRLPQHRCTGLWQRKANVAGAFLYEPDLQKRGLLASSQRIWLVDVLAVTAATLSEAASVLRSRGFQVCGLVVAYE